MNRLNDLVNNNDGFDRVFFTGLSHPTFMLRMKSVFNNEPFDPLKSNQLPVPIFTMKYKRPLVDYLVASRKEVEDMKTRKKYLESLLCRMYRAKEISEEGNLTNMHVKEYISERMKNPELYQSGEIKEFYSRGTLEILNKDESDYLITVWSKKKLKVLQVPEKSHLKCLTGRDDFEKHPYELMMQQNSPYCALRYMNCIKYARVPDNLEHGEIIKTYLTQKEEKLIEACQLRQNKLYLIDCDRNLKRYHIDTQRVTYSLDLKTFGDMKSPFSICQAETIYTNKNSFITVTSKKTFGIIDCRVTSKDTYSNLMSQQDLTMLCEDIFLHIHSLKNSKHVYIATTHLLYLFDFKKIKEPLARWTHHLTKQVAYLKSFMYGNNEIICVASQEPGDVRFFVNTGFSTNHIPLKPLNIANSYNYCREHARNLLAQSIKKRVNMSVTGIAFQAQPEFRKFTMFTETACGDIFKTVITWNELWPQNGDECLDAFEKWENFVEEKANPKKFLTIGERIEQEELVFNDIVRLKGVAKVCNSKAIQKQEADEDMNFITEKIPKWRISIDEAKECTDPIAVQVMSVWDDIPMEESRPELFESALQEKERQTTTDKVAMWLNSTDNKLDTTMDCFDIFNESLTQEPTSSQLPAKPKKKKPRVAGF